MLWYFYQSSSDDNVTISNTFKPVYNGHSTVIYEQMLLITG
jgi:hypothetical protein